MKFVNWWNGLRLQTRLHLVLMFSILVVLTVAQLWLQDVLRDQFRSAAEKRAIAVSDGVINGLNMLMINGVISEPENRQLFIKKMSSAEGIKELRIVRAEQVTKQFGPGLPEEMLKDDLDKKVLQSGKEEFRILSGDNGEIAIRVVVPFIASSSFRGTNCLACHNVAENSVNGVASIIIDLKKEDDFLNNLSILLWAGQLGIQILLFFIIAVVMGSLVFRPLGRVEETVKQILVDPNVSKFVGSSSHNSLDILSFELNNLFGSLKGFDAKKQMSFISKIFEHTNEGIIITSVDGTIDAVNQTFTDITGYTMEDVVGKKPSILQSGRHSLAFYQRMWESLQDAGRWQGEIWNKKKGGEVYPEWLSISSIKDESGQVTHYIAMFTDITMEKEHEEMISYHAYHDSLTGLPNRVLFFDKLSVAIVEASLDRTMLAVLFMDLDRFKKINDTLGHNIGDRLLQEVAKRLVECIGSNGIVARMGGDEFTILLTNIHRIEEVMDAADRITNTLKPSFINTKGHELYVTPSIGISIYPDDGTDPQTLLKNADIAMYRAKDHGRNNFQLFTSSMNVRAFERLLLENNMRHALEKGEFELYYQPQVNIQTMKIIGVEALLRWNHPELGLIYPTEFISMAEETGLILPISEWILHEACTQAKNLHDMGHEPLTMSVNLSPLQFKQKNLADMLDSVLKKTGFNPASLDIEITETIAMKDVEHTKLVLSRMRDIGVNIALDDFGVGYSSLNYLKIFSINKLKIDESFIRDIPVNPDSTAIVNAIIAIANNLKLKIVAEGVETEEQLNALKAEGCDNIQGYYFYKPLPLDALVRVLKKGII